MYVSLIEQIINPYKKYILVYKLYLGRLGFYYGSNNSLRSPVKSSTLSGHAVQSAERSDAGENIIYQVDDMGTAARVFL